MSAARRPQQEAARQRTPRRFLTALRLLPAGDRLPAELPGTLSIFLERLKNEITRLTTVKGKPRPQGAQLTAACC